MESSFVCSHVLQYRARTEPPSTTDGMTTDMHCLKQCQSLTESHEKRNRWHQKVWFEPRAILRTMIQDLMSEQSLVPSHYAFGMLVVCVAFNIDVILRNQHTFGSDFISSYRRVVGRFDSFSFMLAG